MSLSIGVPNLMQDPGFLMCAPLLSTLPVNTAAGGIYTDAWDTAWLPFGATEDGTEFTDSTTVTPITVAEFIAPVQYRVTEQRTEIAFALASVTLSNFKRARNGGAAAITATAGSGGTASYDFTPLLPGTEVRMMIGWESLDHTMRLILPQVICGGETKLSFKKAPANASIPCTFSAELPLTGPLAGLPYKMSTAGSARG